MLPTTTASRVYVAQNITDEDNPNAVVHVEAFEIGQSDQNGDEEDTNTSDRAMTFAGNGGDHHDDTNALYPIRPDEIPRGMQRVLAVTGFVTLVTSPGNPSKLQLGAAFTFGLWVLCQCSSGFG